MLTTQERNYIIDAYMHDNDCSIHDMCKAIERAVLAKALAQQERLHKEWSELWSPIDDLVRPLTPLGESVAAKALDLINMAKAMTKQEPVSKQELAYAIMGFAGGFIGAYLSGFIDTPLTNIAQIYQVARNHVKDSYGIDTKTLIDEIGKEDFDRCYEPVPSQAAAIPEGYCVVSADDLKRINRDLDACQKVIWLAGGFDPAYCKDAQESLKLIDSALSASPKP